MLIDYGPTAPKPHPLGVLGHVIEWGIRVCFSARTEIQWPYDMTPIFALVNRAINFQREVVGSITTSVRFSGNGSQSNDKLGRESYECKPGKKLVFEI